MRETVGAGAAGGAPAPVPDARYGGTLAASDRRIHGAHAATGANDELFSPEGVVRGGADTAMGGRRGDVWVSEGAILGAAGRGDILPAEATEIQAEETE